MSKYEVLECEFVDLEEIVRMDEMDEMDRMEDVDDLNFEFVMDEDEVE